MEQIKYIVMEKLELNHLVGYLPYGLKSYVEYNGHKLIKDINLNNVMCIVDGEVLSKPILRLLSDLTKEIEVNGEKFVPNNAISKCTISGITYNFYKIDSINIFMLPYDIIKKLYEWHFDIHSLIENNIAIDINTLNKQ